MPSDGAACALETIAADVAREYGESPHGVEDHEMAVIDETAFPSLTAAEIECIKPLATVRDYADGEIVFRAGQADIDLYIVESGADRNPQSDRRPPRHRRS